MTEKLAELLDIEEIRNLRFQYAHYLDGNDIDKLDQVFSADATVVVTVGSMHGIDEIRSGLREAFKLYDRDQQGSYPFVHAVTNHWVKLTGPDAAEGRCYLLDFETARKPDPNPLLLLGLYHDKYKRIDGAWRITHTSLEVVWPERAAAVEPTEKM